MPGIPHHPTPPSAARLSFGTRRQSLGFRQPQGPAPGPLRSGRERGGRFRRARSHPVLHEAELHPSHVGAGELQGAFLLVLALIASLAVINLPSEWATLRQAWQSFAEFVVMSVFGV